MKLFLTFSLLTLALLLLGNLVALTAKDLHMTTDLYNTEQASYLAEAGLVLAEHKLASDPSWRGQWFHVPLGAGTYTVRIYDQSGVVKTESTGQVGQAVVKKTASFGP